MFNTRLIPFDASWIPGRFQTTRDIEPEGLSPKVQFGSDELANVDGREVYRLPLQYVDDSGIDTAVSVQVFAKPLTNIPALSLVHLTGTVRISAWDRDGRVRYTFTADGIAVDSMNVSPAASTLYTGGDDD